MTTLQTMASLSDKPTKENESVWANLVTWIQEAGGTVNPSIVLAGEGPSRGVYASKSIEKGEMLIYTKPRTVLSGASLQETWSGDSDASTKQASNWLCCVGAYCTAVTETSHKERFDPYFKSLPNEYESLLKWTDKQLEEYLGGTTLGTIALTDRQEDSIRKRYKLGVRPYLKSLGLFPPNDDAANESQEMQLFMTACMCISTRGFHCKSVQNDDSENDIYNGPFLLPVIDLLNHNPAKKATTLQMDDTGCFFMKAERNIDAHEEIFHSYGQSLTSAQMLQTFGFVAREHSEHLLKDDEIGNNAFPEHFTSAVLSKDKVIGICRQIAASSYPKQLQEKMKSNPELCDDEIWDVTELAKRTMDECVSDDIVVERSKPRLSEKLITLCAVQFLPGDAFDDVFATGESLLDSSILEDFYLGSLVCHSLKAAIKEKAESYDCTSRSADSETVTPNNQLQILLKISRDRLKQLITSDNNIQNSDVSTDTHRAIYGMTICIEELLILQALFDEIASIQSCLQRRIPIQSVHDESNEVPTKRRKL